jgi:hypothetical protein
MSMMQSFARSGDGLRDLLELQFHREIGECSGGGHHG